MLTLALIVAALLSLLVALQSYVVQKVDTFEARTETLVARLDRRKAVWEGFIDLYVKLLAENGQARDEPRAGGRGSSREIEQRAMRCPVNLSIAGDTIDLAQLPCQSKVLLDFWDWTSHCKHCSKSGLMMFDMSGDYLGEYSGHDRPLRRGASAYIAERTEPIRHALSRLPRQADDIRRGIWLPPQYDSASGQYVLHFVKSFANVDGHDGVMVLQQAINKNLLPPTFNASGKLALLYEGGTIDVVGHSNQTVAWRNAMFASTSGATRSVWRQLYDSEFHLTRRSPGTDWIWVQTVDKKEFLGDMWLPIASRVVLIGCLTVGLWLMIVWFDRRILRPIQQQSRQGRESRKFEQAMTELLPVGFTVLRHTTNEILFQNARSRNIRDSYDPDDLERVRSVTFERISNHDYAAQPSFSFEIEVPHSRGPQHLELIVHSVRYAGEDVVLVASYDKTADRQTEALLQEAKSAAESANRAKGDFLAIMSHEIRTPLHGALSNLEILALSSLNRSQQERLGVIQRAFTSLLALLDNALDFSKLDARLFKSRPKAFNLRGMVEQVILAALPLVAERDVRITYQVMDGGAPLIGDEHLLRQVIVNLLHNALKFTRVGKVEIACQRKRRNDGRDLLYIEVRDTGAGISSRDMQSIFEPYVQGVSSHNASLRGTGLGLALCRQICDLLEGEIRVESQLGVGSVFSLTIPAEWAEGPAVPYDWPASHGRVAVIHVRCAEPSNDLAEVLSAAGWQVRKRVGDSTRPSKDWEHGALHVLVTDHYEPNRLLPGTDLIVADDGPLHPTLAGNAYVVSAYALDALRIAWRAIQDGTDIRESLERPGAVAISDTYRDIRVLIADDDVTCRHVLRSQLEILGIAHVDMVANGDEGLAHVELREYDLILTDLNMPQADGRLFIAALAELELGAVLMLTTADVAWERSVGPLRSRIADVLIKPSSLTVLRDAIERSMPTRLVQPSEPTQQFAMLGDVADLFAQSLRNDWADARAALELLDREAMMQILHKMSGALVVMKEERLGRTLQALEKHCRDDSRAVLLDLFAEAESQFDEVVKRYARHVEP
ncbi:hybrid sensor histidine kinase/response regulator [Burkholderia sp. ISTR5]|uniref:hybrid sensor histidine kinase/response regulator n=1 Tax=Burkholderia sp. ISTR5 TaxID=2500161 RepID=UPI00136B4239|nr:hybrid sensor histidine kinase/response regulator [Burkholderia sp. ISTR5]NBI50501.1 sensor histidine kinase [Burkholderia sp. ISTR5]